jgi:hypothetical protein
MTDITERIAIGEGHDQPFKGCKSVFNLAADLWVDVATGVEYTAIGLIDGPGNMKGTLVAAVCVLHQLLSRHSKVVLICHGGSGRSGLVAALYMTVRHEVSLEQALNIVKSHRPQAVPNGELLKVAESVIPLLRDLVKQG